MKSDSKLCVLFPGGGVQFHGMGSELNKEYPVAREAFDEVEDILHEPVRSWCFGSMRAIQNDMRKALVCIFTYGVANYRVYHEVVNAPVAYMAGHSLGEYTALTCSGVLSLREASLLVSRRGELLEEAGRREVGMMAITGIGNKTVESLCEEVNMELPQVFVSVYNSPLQSVVSGTLAGLAKMQMVTTASGGECKMLNIRTASHCPLLSAEAHKFRHHLLQVVFKSPHTPVVSNLTATPYAADTDWVEVLSQHLVSPVLWHQSMNYLFLNEGMEKAVDIGPQSVLKDLLTYTAPHVRTFTVNSKSEMDRLRTEADVLNNPVLRVLRECMLYCASTRNNNPGFPHSVVAQIMQLKKMIADARKEIKLMDEAQLAVKLTHEILKEKKISEEEMADFVGKMTMYLK